MKLDFPRSCENSGDEEIKPLCSFSNFSGTKHVFCHSVKWDTKHLAARLLEFDENRDLSIRMLR